MKTKLKFIIPIVIAVIAIIIAALCINFTPQERADVSSLMSTAQKYLIENQYEQAIAEFNKVIKLEPKNVDAYIGLAEAYIGMGDISKAIEVLEKGYEITGDERLKNMIDELNSENSVAEVTTVTSKTETEVTTEESKPTELQISYADDWYSIFNYDNDGNILNMSLYNKNGEQRLSAEYEYTGNSVKRTVYVDNNLYEANNVTFTDIMADVEKQKKERANTREEHDNNWWVYDENGDCIEHGCHNLDSNGNLDYNSGQEFYYQNCKIYKSHYYYQGYDGIEYFDEKGYPLNEEEIVDIYGNNNNVAYTYQYDDNGYPIIQYANGEKSNEYTNFYNSNKLGYAVYHSKNEYNDYHGIKPNNNDGYDTCIELNKEGQYIRQMFHLYNINDYVDIPDNLYTYVTYYVPSFDETKMIDAIWIDCSNIKPLFECPYCNK